MRKLTPTDELSPPRLRRVMCWLVGHHPARTRVTWRQRRLGDRGLSSLRSAPGPLGCLRCNAILDPDPVSPFPKSQVSSAEDLANLLVIDSVQIWWDEL